MQSLRAFGRADSYHRSTHINQSNEEFEIYAEQKTKPTSDIRFEQYIEYTNEYSLIKNIGIHDELEQTHLPKNSK
jgi:hypothetical protein